MQETVAQETPCPPPGYGDFEIARREDGSLWELGRGSMGVTYKAVDRVLHRAVALKVIQLGAGGAGDGRTGEALRERFLREARAAAALRHANVAGVFQFGASEQAGRCYYAMELVEGETLEARVRREGPLAAGPALEVARQVTAALVAAADRGLIHRDLKPGNLMLTGGGLAGAGLEVKVIDFGLAKAAATAGETDLTHGGFVGTPAFASPEQCARRPVDARSDLYSLGITLWYALTGGVPFTARTPEERCDHPAREPLPVERLAARGVPGCVVALLRRLLALDPDGRPASAKELLGALETCQAQMAAGRARPAAWRRLAAALALAAGGGVWWWAHLPASADRRTAAVPPGPTAAVVPEKSVAVLPFANFSEDKDGAFFADGVQDEILTDLARVADLKVISRTSVMQYHSGSQRNLREIAAQLGVAHVVEGSVQKAGNKVRVKAQLINARTDTHEWAEEYDRDLSDVFAIQSDIAGAVAGQLQAFISPQEHAAMEEIPTRNEQAYQLYLRALARWNDWDTLSSEEHPKGAETMSLLQQATVRDPGFARAFAFMTEVRANLYGGDPTPANEAAARGNAETVVRLRPGSADADVAMGCYDDLVRRDFLRAHDDFAAAVRQAPNDARAYEHLGLIERRGHWDEALVHLRRALELDPENNNYFVAYGWALYGLGNFRELLALTDRRIATHPSQYWLRAHKVHVLLAWKADTHAAQAELAFMPPGADPNGWTTFHRLECDTMARDFPAAARDLAACPLAEIADAPRAIAEGDIARLRGDAGAAVAAYGEARPWVETQVRNHPQETYPLYLLAKLDALLGRKEAALDEGRRLVSLATAGDPLLVPSVTYEWARVLTFAGEHDEAIRALQTICGEPYAPGDLPHGPQYGYLHADPDWDPLRGDPRFAEMVASLAPKP